MAKARSGRQASDDLGRVAFVFLLSCTIGVLVVPGILVYHLVTGDPQEAGAWGLGSLTCLFIAFMLTSGLINSSRDNRRLRASGIPGTAKILSVESREDSIAAVLLIQADGLETFEADAVFSWGRVRVGAQVDVVIDPSDRLFAVI
ncbi:hypothetical protein ACH47X_06380 [Promicromonospora kroppenstedtii]|uniref:NfeD-like C-terminal domain-containing protein n=1 Tax=Promicromonospora kroppenstedtii TaxID=440482 RepID=A0ABW7XG79_9MICO